MSIIQIVSVAIKPFKKGKARFQLTTIFKPNEEHVLGLQMEWNYHLSVFCLRQLNSNPGAGNVMGTGIDNREMA